MKGLNNCFLSPSFQQDDKLIRKRKDKRFLSIIHMLERIFFNGKESRNQLLKGKGNFRPWVKY